MYSEKTVENTLFELAREGLVSQAEGDVAEVHAQGKPAPIAERRALLGGHARREGGASLRLATDVVPFVPSVPPTESQAHGCRTVLRRTGLLRFAGPHQCNFQTCVRQSAYLRVI